VLLEDIEPRRGVVDFVQDRLRGDVFLELLDLGVDLPLDTQPVGDRG